MLKKYKSYCKDLYKKVMSGKTVDLFYCAVILLPVVMLFTVVMSVFILCKVTCKIAEVIN